MIATQQSGDERIASTQRVTQEPTHELVGFPTARQEGVPSAIDLCVPDVRACNAAGGHKPARLAGRSNCVACTCVVSKLRTGRISPTAT
jgi:hypothetical protein